MIYALATLHALTLLAYLSRKGNGFICLATFTLLLTWAAWKGG